MKKLILLVLLFAVPTLAQTATHQAKLTWVDGLNPSGTTYSIYRAPGLCSGTPVFAKIATAVSGLTFTDTTVLPGNYCFAVTAVSGGVESAQSAPVLASVPSFAVTQLQVVVQ